MNTIEVVFKGMDSSDALKAKTVEKFSMLDNLLTDAARVKVTYWAYDKKKVSDVIIEDGKAKYFAKSHSDDAYKTLELLKDKVKRQILKDKN